MHKVNSTTARYRGFIVEITMIIASSQKTPCCRAAAAHSPFPGTCYGHLKDRTTVTTHDKQLSKVSLEKVIIYS